MVMNELLDKDTKNMSIKELEKHINTTIMTLYDITKKRYEECHTIFEAAKWHGDNQSPGIRAGVMALYNLHVGEGMLSIQPTAEDRLKFTVSPNRKNPINYSSRNGSSHHAFDAYEMVKIINEQYDPKKTVFELTINGSPTMQTEANVKGRRFADAYMLMMLACQGGRYGGEHNKVFSEAILKTDKSSLYLSSIYNQNHESLEAYTVAHADPFLKYSSLKDYIISDNMKKTAFVNLIVQNDNAPPFITFTGAKELLPNYWASFLEKNYHRCRDQFMSETYDKVRDALRETRQAEELGKVV